MANYFAEESWQKKKNLENFQKFSTARIVRLRDKGTIIQALGSGSIAVTLERGDVKNIRLHDVLYVPDLGKSLLSVPAMTSKGAQGVFGNTECKIWKNDMLLGIASKNGNVYEINVISSSCAAVALTEDSLVLWHSRFGHSNMQSLRKAVNEEAVTGIENVSLNELNCGSDVQSLLSNG